MSTEHITVGLVGYQNDYRSTLLRAFLDDKTYPVKSGILSIHEAQILKCASTDTTCYISRKHGLGGREFCAHQGHQSDQVVVSRDVSFLALPDKIEYASTVLGGMYLLDGILILSDAKLNFSRLPTLELIAAASMLNKKVVLIQILNDVSEADSRIVEHYQEITQLIGKMNLEKPIIIPVLVSGTSDIGTLCARINDMCLEEYDKQAPVEMLIIDNFLKEDEETGETVLTISARILKGTVKKNQQLEIRPGSVSRDKDGQPKCNPIIINVASLDSIRGNVQLEQAVAGDMIAIRSNINYDRIGGIVVNLSGYIIGDVNSLPEVFSAMKVKISLLPLMFNSYIEEFKEVPKIEKDEKLLLTIGMLSAEARVWKIVNENTIIVSLRSPICARIKDKVFLLRPMNVSWRLIGHGQIEDGKAIRIDESIHG
ncbi:eukaryotic translation initiation factor 2 subunit 3-like [Lolium rigidum]|uniref:eukaryotic translation initiation factor 2 subunit 3-like n=1 Tax=Lolium rigidum TaxID=89674 RepID=UPI001F5E3363|nr:eukaryotic translation initiation factor 2 subunit 3-like [Lolium rigidum]